MSRSDVTLSRMFIRRMMALAGMMTLLPAHEYLNHRPQSKSPKSTFVMFFVVSKTVLFFGGGIMYDMLLMTFLFRMLFFVGDGQWHVCCAWPGKDMPLHSQKWCCNANVWWFLSRSSLCFLRNWLHYLFCEAGFQVVCRCFYCQNPLSVQLGSTHCFQGWAMDGLVQSGSASGFPSSLTTMALIFLSTRRVCMGLHW